MFDLGMNFCDSQSWLTTGACYQRYQVNMLYQAVHSYSYKVSQYHFLFMHFEPNSTWPSSEDFSVPASILQYQRYFSVVFCGHEGGSEIVFMHNSTLVVHRAHLGDGNLKTDTYLPVHISGLTKTMTIASNNFETGKQCTLYTGRVWWPDKKRISNDSRAWQKLSTTNYGLQVKKDLHWSFGHSVRTERRITQNR